jgi:hypothetical protein
MQTIIAQPGRHAHPNPDAAARQRRDRLAQATTDQMKSALALLSMIDPEAFEIAFTAVVNEMPEEDEGIPLCRHCILTRTWCVMLECQWVAIRFD